MLGSVVQDDEKCGQETQKLDVDQHPGGGLIRHTFGFDQHFTDHVVLDFQHRHDVRTDPDAGLAGGDVAQFFEQQKPEPRPKEKPRKKKPAEKKAAAQAKAAGFDGKVEVHVGLTSPTRAVLECVERFSPELLVMGTISRGGGTFRTNPRV